MPIREKIIFTGSRSDIPDLLDAMDMFTLASVSEGFPNVLLEAMAMAKPMVAGRVGALADIVLHGETGLLVDPSAPTDLAQAICTLLRSPAQARHMGVRGRDRVETCFSRQRQVSDVLALYHRLRHDPSLAVILSPSHGSG